MEYKVIQSNWMPKRFDAIALFGCLILMRDTSNEELFQHELIHLVQQREVGIFKYHFLWFFNKSFRAKVEATAYRAHGVSDSNIMHILSVKYDLSYQEAKELI